jgi:hypothetical protein
VVAVGGVPPADVAVLGREQRFGFAFFVFAPLPLGTRVLDVLGLDAAGRQVASVGADLSGVPGAVCRS